ncbi:LuxR C-terminal-related transcriptional regulator [Streptomyces sp. NPDC017936]|uniref:helix-turn-helix transcriptional regulator n=1 Tax=Streptomyces sp. NPDC017936 TaxID=3365016 RepID=UPI0037AD475C
MSGQTTVRGGWVRAVTGEPGCGRTWFLDSAARSFSAGAVVRVRADPARAAVPGSGLRTLLRALGDATGPVSTGLSGQGLLAALRAAATPLLVCVDDAHLWDPASRAALGHAAARLRGTADVSLLLSVPGHRPPGPEFAGLPLLRIDPLSPEEAGALVDEATGGAVDARVRDDVVDAAEGNPALLLAVVRRLSPAQLRGERPLPLPPADGEVLTALAGGHLTGTTPEQHDLLLTVAAALRDEGDAGNAGRAGAADATPATPWATGHAAVDLGLVLRAVGHLHDRPRTASDPLPDLLAATDDEVRFHSELLRRTVYEAAPAERRRAVHRALARALESEGPALRTVLHRAWAGTGTAAGLAAAAAGPAGAGPHGPRCAAYTRAAELAADAPQRAEWYTAAAEQALLAGRSHRALRLLDRARTGGAPDPVRGRAELLRGTTVLHDGPVDEARASLLLAASLLAEAAPDQAEAAALGASDAAWAAGDPVGCAHALGRCADPAAAGDGPGDGGGPTGGVASADDAVAVRAWAGAGVGAGVVGSRAAAGPAGPGTAGGAVGGGDAVHAGAGAGAGTVGPRAAAGPAVPGPAEAPSPSRDLSAGTAASAGGSAPAGRSLSRDYRRGLRALLEGDFRAAAAPLRRVVECAEGGDGPEEALRAAGAALLLGDLDAGRRAGARALAAARTLDAATAVPRAREYLAYVELRAGRHALARTHAEEGLRAARAARLRNTAAHHHAVLALAASIEGETDLVARHVAAALATARRHGLAQAATLAEWATARADLGRGRPQEAADRLGPLVRPGPRRGHFAVWMLAVPCFVEAAVSAGRPDGARAAVEDFARWARFGADPQAPAQLLRCQALLAAPDRADALYRHALDLHEAAGGDFERARTELLHGKWLRRRRRLGEARDRLGAALVGFERCGARAWAEQTRGELRANGASPSGTRAGPGLSLLTPQQLRIARRVAEGATNREVALTLSVSTRTVDYHLRRVFAALGVRSRVELARLVEQAEKSGAHP